MRVIRTELYFDKNSIKASKQGRRRFGSFRRSEDEIYEGIGFAWFKANSPSPHNLLNFKWFDGREISRDEVSPALDIILRDEDGRRLNFLRDRLMEVENPEIVNFVLDQPIVFENSPPSAAKFKDLLAKTNAPIYVGAYIGAHMAGDNPAMMLVTIPGGIIAVSSALGISEAIAYGLNKHIRRLFGEK